MARKLLTLSERAQIVKRLNSGEKNVDIAAYYGVSHSTVTRIAIGKENILRKERILIEQHVDKSTHRSVGLDSSQFEQILYAWYTEQKKLGVTISGSTIQEQALIMNEEYNGPKTFKAGDRWLHRFKTKHGIYVQEYIDQYGYTLDDIYNASDTTLHWKALPRKITESQNETDPCRYKVADDRITVVACANAMGTHKIPLLVIGKEKEPRCFKNLEVLPVKYIDQWNGSMERIDG